MTDVRGIDLEALRSAGIKALLLDIDNTVMPLHSTACPLWLEEWVRGLRDKGFKVAFVSNTWRDDIGERVGRFACPVTAKAMKPLVHGFRAAARVLGVRMDETAMVGDQIFTDVLGGNLAGATTVLVQPLSSSDLPHTLLLRRLERIIMAGRTPHRGPGG